MTTDIGDITNWPPHCFRTPKHCPLCLKLECECEEPEESLQATIVEQRERKDLE